MLSLFSEFNDTIRIGNVDYAIDFNFNVVLANLELSQNTELSDRTKIRVSLCNYLNLCQEDLGGWDIKQQREIYLAITAKLFGQPIQKSGNESKSDDKSVYSFIEDAGFIFASFLKDYNIDLIERRNKMHWDVFKALFVSLSSDTKIVEVMGIRNWKPDPKTPKEKTDSMQKLQKIYALKSTQKELESVISERVKMAGMTPDERVSYAKEQLHKLERGG